MSKALDIHHLLVQEYGDRPWAPRADPLSELIGTILSQNTSDINSGRAFESLRAAFPTWEAVCDAPVDAVAAAIHCGGLAAIKAPRIQCVLTTIAGQRGDLDLAFLADLPVDDARRWLMSLDGVGAKTAACVLMFSLGKPVMPVDTHVHRVSQRLGLAAPKDTAEETEAILESLLPPESRYAFHLNVIAHGRKVCKAQRPRCAICVLAGLCDYLALHPDLAAPSCDSASARALPRGAGVS
jgi:endonuclease III